MIIINKFHKIFTGKLEHTRRRGFRQFRVDRGFFTGNSTKYNTVSK